MEYAGLQDWMCLFFNCYSMVWKEYNLTVKGPSKPCKTFVNKVAHSLKHVVYIWKCRFLFPKCEHSCKKVWQEPTVDSIDDANAVLKDVFGVKASAALTFTICPFKEYSYSMEMLFCFEKGAMWPSKGLQSVQYLCKQRRVLLETMQNKVVAVNKCYMPVQRVQ